MERVNTRSIVVVCKVYELKIGHLKSANPVPVKSRLTGEIYTLYNHVTAETGITDFNITHEQLPPGHRSSAPHSHTKKDELYIVLSGFPVAYVNDEKIALSEGQYIAFKSASNEIHYLANETEDIVELLMISSCPDDDIVEYQK